MLYSKRSEILHEIQMMDLPVEVKEKVSAVVEGSESVDIIRCGDCGWKWTTEDDELTCFNHRGLVSAKHDGFCCYGRIKGRNEKDSDCANNSVCNG